MSMLQQIMDIVYTEKIREEEGGTYGVATSGSIARYPEGQTILQINFDTDPDKARALNNLVKGESNSWERSPCGRFLQSKRVYAQGVQ